MGSAFQSIPDSPGIEIAYRKIATKYGEPWLSIIRGEEDYMPEGQMYFNESVEPLLNTPEMRARQLEGLKRAVRYFYEKVPFERRRLDKAQVRPDDIQTFGDFAKSIPIIGQADYRKPWMEEDWICRRYIRISLEKSDSTISSC